MKKYECPHCRKEINTLILIVMKDIKRHFRDVKRCLKTLDYLGKSDGNV